MVLLYNYSFKISFNLVFKVKDAFFCVFFFSFKKGSRAATV